MNPSVSVAPAETSVLNYLKTIRPALAEQIKFEMQSQDKLPKDMLMQFRSVLNSGFTWIANFEQHRDAPAIRAMHQAAFKVGGAKAMLDTYLAATEQVLSPAALQECSDFEHYYQQAIDEEKALAA